MKNRIKKISLFVALILSLQISMIASTANYFTPYASAATLIKAPLTNFNRTTPSTGSVNALVFKVDFPDVTYTSSALSTSELQQSIFGAENTSSQFYPMESVKAYYNRASYGNLKLSGNVYSYTAQHNRSYYNNKNEYETLVMEVLDYYNSKIDYSKYDGNKDGYIDCLSIGVPTNGSSDDSFWYGCQATWYLNDGYSVDGVKIKGYIINDEQPNKDSVSTYNATLAHEIGHSMGLPDYYKYNSGSDWEGMKGEAGYERMDDSWGDFSSFSKLMYGWLTSDKVKVADLTKSSSTYTLSSASTSGNCIIVPVGTLDKNYFSEYFLIEYLTPEKNNSGLFNNGGIRVLHVDADVITDASNSKYKSFAYENYSSKYDTSNNGRRVIRLVNDDGGFYTEGAVIKYGVSNFAGYDSNGKETKNPGFSINVGKLSGGSYQITINKN